MMLAILGWALAEETDGKGTERDKVPIRPPRLGGNGPSRSPRLGPSLPANSPSEQDFSECLLISQPGGSGAE